MDMGPTSLLTTHGVRQLYQDAAGTATRLQVLGVYRYLADPALKERLGQTFAAATDVFDVLLSDGRYKIKAVLAPNCHNLVWTRALSARCIIRVTKFKVFCEDLEDEKQKLRVVLLQELVVTSLHEKGVLPDKVVARRYGANTNNDQLQFYSTMHPREVDLIPLVGERVYYLPLRSDHYTLDWDCSFTEVADEDSPLDELERWTRGYGELETADGSNDDHEVTTSSVMVWSTTLENCDDLFTPECKRIHTILEVVEKIQKSNQLRSNLKPHPPMLGVIRVKSNVMNLGDPDISNPFPFAFNVVVVDTTSVFEVMFFGSMCAKYYLSLHEGDLVQLRGYKSTSPQELQETRTTSPLAFYEHDSSGTVLRVPKKYWKFLEMTKVAPPMLEVSNDILQSSQQPDSCHPSWLECNFVNTLNTLYWGKNAMDSLKIMHFDFVGVLSNVGKICRGRKRRLDEDDQELTEYRWVKMIDSSSSHELVIRLSECSQPAVFRSLEAGNTLMITKLQWVVLPGAQSGDKRIQYATTSVYSVLRLNEAVIPFHSIEECNLNVYFATNLEKNASRKINGETKLTAHIEKKYRPRNRLPSNVEEFKEAFGLRVCSFSDLVRLLLRMEAYEQQHVGFIGQVKAVNNEANPAKDRGPSVLLELNESKDTDHILTVAVTVTPLYERPTAKGYVKSITPTESLRLIRLLPTEVVDDMYAKAVQDNCGPVRRHPELSLSFIEEYLTRSEREFFFSLQLHRDDIGKVTWEVDAVLAMP